MRTDATRLWLWLMSDKHLKALLEDAVMPRGAKAAYTDKQKREARHIEDSYRKRGSSEKRAERIA